MTHGLPSARTCLSIEGRTNCSFPTASTACVRLVAFERLQYRADLILDGRLSQVELAADPLVRLTLHHQCEDLGLSLGKTDVGRRPLALRRLRYKRLIGRTSPHKLRWYVNASSKHQA